MKQKTFFEEILLPVSDTLAKRRKDKRIDIFLDSLFKKYNDTLLQIDDRYLETISFSKLYDTIEKVEQRILQSLKDYFKGHLDGAVAELSFLLLDIDLVDGFNTTVLNKNDIWYRSRLKEDGTRLYERKEDWYVFTDNYGTPKEKAFVAAFNRYYDDLHTAYSEVYLVRNEGEKELATYSFNGGHLFEPDYILFLKRKYSDDRNEQIQIFIEPKGDGYIATDLWKEEFLLDIEKIGIPVITFVDNTDYRIRGFHFFNRNKRREEFTNDMNSIIN